MRVEVWSDVVCPWCCIGKRRLEAALRRFPHRDEVELVRRSFRLEHHLADGVSGNTSLAHELLHHATEHGRQGEPEERLLRAHSTEAGRSSTSTRWSRRRRRSAWTPTRRARH